MPYIKQERRNTLNESIDELSNELIDNTSQNGVFNVGDLNYAISSIIGNLAHSKLNYGMINDIMGVLSCVSNEFYRRVAVPYETKKIQENGDL